MHVRLMHRRSHSGLGYGMRKRCAHLQPSVASITDVSPASQAS